jgi:anti-sigma regulatory factor (Ser/Thr protein kinase)
MMPAAVVLGSLTIRGRPEQVSRARAFVTALAGPAAESAALLTSELVANAVLHTSSGHDGGTVTVVVSDVPDGLLVEVVDDGSPDGGPEVSGDRYATSGHGLFLVEQLAARWGFVQDGAGTTVWFQVAAGSDPARDGQLGRLARTDNWARRPGTESGAR